MASERVDRAPHLPNIDMALDVLEDTLRRQLGVRTVANELREVLDRLERSDINHTRTVRTYAEVIAAQPHLTPVQRARLEALHLDPAPIEL